MADFRTLVPFGASFARDPFESLRHELDRAFSGAMRAWPEGAGDKGKGFLIPKVDVAESDAGIELTAELPGFDDKDVSLDIHDGVLTIKAEHQDRREEKDEKKHYHLVERSEGTFLRRFSLPFEPDASKASAHLDKGLLKVVVPRLAEKKKAPKSIPIGKNPAA